MTKRRLETLALPDLKSPQFPRNSFWQDGAGSRILRKHELSFIFIIETGKL
ncbi:MAG: hypothetical protein WCH07_04325 [Deltaproteobacteria bacterium]